MTFVKTDEQEAQRQKEEDAIREIQEKKRKDLEDQLKKRGQAVKNHKPVQNLDIPANQQPVAIPPIQIINNLLLNIANENYPAIDIKKIDPYFTTIREAKLNPIIEQISKAIEAELKQAKEYTDEKMQYYVTQIFACVRELVIFNFITTNTEGEGGTTVKMNPKCLAYLNAVAYLIPAGDFRNQYAVYHSLWNA